MNGMELTGLASNNLIVRALPDLQCVGSAFAKLSKLLRYHALRQPAFPDAGIVASQHQGMAFP